MVKFMLLHMKHNYLYESDGWYLGYSNGKTENLSFMREWNCWCRLGHAFITARKRSLREGYVFTPVCDSVNRGVCMVLFGGACVVLFGGGVCVVLFGGHVWFYWGGMRGFIWGHMHGFIRGHAWFYSGMGRAWFFSFFGYNEIRSMSGWYASYWNAFLFLY